MANIMLDKLDSVPVANSNFTFEFNSWVSVLVDVLNQNLSEIETYFNILHAPSYTSAEITALNAAGDLDNGVILYDTDLHEYVGKKSGSLVKFTTTAYP